MASCHSANSFALATLVMLLYRLRRLSVFIFIWAVLHTYTRIYLGVHYLGDIVVGGFVGATIAWLLYRLTARFVNFEPEPTNSHPNFVIYTGVGIFTLLILISCVSLMFGISVFE